MYLFDGEVLTDGAINKSSAAQTIIAPGTRLFAQSKEADISTMATLICQLVAVSFALDAADLLSSERGTAKTARARHIAIYLLHTSLSMKQSEIADLFSRDRTTIGYSCKKVEDMREMPSFEKHVRGCEKIIDLLGELFSNAGYRKFHG